MVSIRCNNIYFIVDSMEPNVASTVIFLDIAKDDWEALVFAYVPQENICLVYCLYEEIFAMK